MNVTELLKKYAAKGYACNVTIVYRDEPYSPADRPWKSEDSPEERVDTVGVFLQAKHVKYGLATDEQYDQDTIANNETRFLIGAENLPRDPTLRCSLVINEVTWRIVSITPIRPGGKPLIYIFQVRQ